MTEAEARLIYVIYELFSWKGNKKLWSDVSMSFWTSVPYYFIIFYLKEEPLITKGMKSFENIETLSDNSKVTPIFQNLSYK